MLPGDLPPHEHVYDGVGPGETQRDRGSDTRSLKLWRDHLESDLGDRIIAATQPLAAEFGYAADEQP